MADYIKITTKLDCKWVWRLTAADGHIVDESEAFSTRALCETDALKQGLPVRGLTKQSRRSPSARIANSAPLWEFTHDDRGWMWERYGADGDRLACSVRRFATRRDVVADAVSHGYVRSQGKGSR